MVLIYHIPEENMKIPTRFSRWHWFQYLSCGVLAFFFSIMFYVAFIAFTRSSGSTNLDMAKIQKMRYDAEQNQLTKRL